MKKIAFFVPSFNVGGVEKTFITIANKLLDLEYLVDIVVCNFSGELTDLLSKKVRIIDLGGIRVRNSLFPLMRYIKTTTPDILISGPNFPNFLAIMVKMIVRPKTKIIITQHNFFDIESKKLGTYGKMQPFLTKILYPKADKIIAVSDGIVQYLVKQGIDEKKITRIYNPVDCSSISRMAEQFPLLKQMDLGDNYILFIGRLSPVKNIELIINSYSIVLKRQSNIKLVIIGDGNERSKLENLCKELKIDNNVFFLGALINPYYFLKRCRLLVLSSLSESLSVVLIEALSLGKTIVSTPCTGPLEILKVSEYGYVSNDFSNEKEYADLMEVGLKTPFLKEVLQKRAMDFDASIVISEYESVFNKLFAYQK